MKVPVLCKQCQKIKWVTKSNFSSAKKRFCRSCAAKNDRTLKFPPSRRGIHSGLGYIGSDGYKNISTGIRKYKKEHRLVIEQNIGRELTSKEIVHHINLDKLDNRLENLYLCESDSKHQVVHTSLDSVVKKLIDLGIISFSNGVYLMAHVKPCELLEHPEAGNQQPSPRNREGSETIPIGSRVMLAPEAQGPARAGDDIVHSSDITNETGG